MRESHTIQDIRDKKVIQIEAMCFSFFFKRLWSWEFIEYKILDDKVVTEHSFLGTKAVS